MGVFVKGNRFFIDYYVNGRRKREVVGHVDKITSSMAEKALKARAGEIVQGKFNLQQTKKPVPFEKLLDRYLEYVRNNYRAHVRAEGMRNIFLAHFDGMNLSQISFWHIEKYKSDRKAMGRKPSTVNRELTILKRMLT